MTVVTEEPKRETGFLSSTDAAQPMEDRPARPETNILGPAWRLQFKIGDKKILLDMDEIIMVGRTADGEEAKGLNLDLSSFGAYQNGVSRQHAAITRHEGGLYIEDLGSTNGTRINGFQLTPRRKYRLRDGDEVEFARIRALIRFVRPSDVMNEA
jgi:hypothetical protein